MTAADTNAFRSRLNLKPGKTALFIGGVDARKGIDFLMESAWEIERQLPGFVLLVAGAGAQAEVVEGVQRSGGPVRYLGRVDGDAKALAIAAADLFMIPEWIGLVAVDSLVSGRPIVTTRHDSHSPEFEYLRADSNAVVTEHEIAAYCAGVIALLRDPSLREQLGTQGQYDSLELTMERLVGNYVMGILRWCGR
jgi:glycosyltransferase involved in cell wall biosynthesis